MLLLLEIDESSLYGYLVPSRLRLVAVWRTCRRPEPLGKRSLDNSFKAAKRLFRVGLRSGKLCPRGADAMVALAGPPSPLTATAAGRPNGSPNVSGTSCSLGTSPSLTQSSYYAINASHICARSPGSQLYTLEHSIFYLQPGGCMCGPSGVSDWPPRSSVFHHKCPLKIEFICLAERHEKDFQGETS